MRRLGAFLYQFFFIDQKTKTLSHTKFFNVIGLTLMCVLFPYAVVKGDAAGFEIWLAMGVIVVGSRAASKWAEARTKMNDFDDYGHGGFNGYGGRRGGRRKDYGPRVDDVLEGEGLGEPDADDDRRRGK